MLNKNVTKSINDEGYIAEFLNDTITVSNVIPLRKSLELIVGSEYTENIKDMLESTSKLDLVDLNTDTIQSYGFSAPIARKIFGAIQFGLGINKKDFSGKVIHTSVDAAMLAQHLQFEKQEHLMVVGLNLKHEVLLRETIFIGSSVVTVAHTREIMKKLINKNGVVSFIIYHNHPSGDPSPSEPDILITEQIIEAARILDLSFVDHIIIGDNSFTSLREQGHILID